MITKVHQTHQLEADLVVIGGGMSGVCAALAAARNNASVVLIQDRSVLGGNASSEIKMHIVGADLHNKRAGARETGIIEELRLEDAYRNPYRSYSQWDLLLYEKVKLHPNITLLLDTVFLNCTMDEATGSIRQIRALRHLTEDLYEISGRFFADCSGDCALARESGADYREGREAKHEYNESMGQEQADNSRLGSSILITARLHDTPQPFHTPKWARKFTAEQLKHRPISNFEYGYWWFEWGGHLDTVKDNETIRHELLRIALGVWDYAKNSGLYPEAANWALDWVGSIPGKRESRRFIGPHVLNENDLKTGRIFEDAVAYGGWPFDTHPIMGTDAYDERACAHVPLDGLYTIPLRALRSRNVQNLLCAGRNISATHIAFASTRVMATCSVMGQAIGTAAAVAADEGTTLEDINITRVQQTLLKDDAFIPSVVANDPADLARKAKVSASSEAEGLAATSVVDGIARDLHYEGLGPWADGQKHHWSSTSLPASLFLDWETPAEFHEIHLTFNSGLHRDLILTASDRITARVIRDAQPEIVSDYQLLADGRVIAEETGNISRKKVHSLPEKITAKQLELRILAVHNCTEAHVFEVRVY